MNYEIKKYAVRHPLLKRNIKFFRELYIEHMQLNHRIISQRNINLRFNLNETPQYLTLNFDNIEKLKAIGEAMRKSKEFAEFITLIALGSLSVTLHDQLRKWQFPIEIRY
ncbi:MAG: hypothetical protein ACM34K_14265 [Bacillota bacterium]